MPTAPRRRSLVRDVKTVLHKEEGSSLVPAAFLAFAILDAIPTPTDIGYFQMQRWLEDHHDELTPKQRWAYQYFNYYGWDVLWYLALFAATYYGGTTLKGKAQIGIGLLSAGALAALLWRYSQEEPPGERTRQLPGPVGEGEGEEEGHGPATAKARTQRFDAWGER